MQAADAKPVERELQPCRQTLTDAQNFAARMRGPAARRRGSGGGAGPVLPSKLAKEMGMPLRRPPLHRGRRRASGGISNGRTVAGPHSGTVGAACTLC